MDHDDILLGKGDIIKQEGNSEIFYSLNLHIDNIMWNVQTVFNSKSFRRKFSNSFAFWNSEYIPLVKV